VQRRYADAGCLVALDVALRDRGAPGDGITSVHQRAVVADADLHAGGAHSLQHRALANVAARDVMTHFGERDGDGAHAGATDADHVQRTRLTQVERGDGCGGHARATRSTRATRLAAAVHGPRRMGGGCDLRELGGVCEEPFDLANEMIDGEVGLFHQQRRALRREDLRVVDLVVLSGARPRHDDGRRAHCGQLGDGAGAAARHQQVGGGVEHGHAVFVPDHAIQDAVLAVATGRGRAEKAVTHHVVHREIRAIGQPVHRAARPRR
jgi:hypothetical protein